MKVVKHLLMKTGGASSPDFLDGLLNYRNTPRDGGRSPAELVFGITLRSKVPMLPAVCLTPTVMVPEHEARTAENARKVKVKWDLTARTLLPIPVGTRVLVQSDVNKRWRSTGIITQAGLFWDYWIRMDSGSRVLRNWRFIRPLAAEVPPGNPEDPTDPGHQGDP